MAEAVLKERFISRQLKVIQMIVPEFLSKWKCGLRE